MDSIRPILHGFGLGLTLVFGLACLFMPAFVAKASHFDLLGARGTAEFRIALGGFFIGMALYAILAASKDATRTVGLAWLGGFVTRGLTLFLDRPKVDRSFLALWASEITVGVMLFV